MKRFVYLFALAVVGFFHLSACSDQSTPSTISYSPNLEDSLSLERIKGVSLEMPGNEVGIDRFEDLKTSNAEWAAMIPYGYTNEGEASVNFNYGGNWWGESVKGCVASIRYAQEVGLKVMLKPHVWVVGQGWPGDFDLHSEKDWETWEKTYREYILAYAHVADTTEVDLFCIGTEYRKAVVKRPNFWKQLIKEVREIYDGELTYASNWDNYHNVGFWSDLDIIGVDAYFPLSSKARPTLEELKAGWTPVQDSLGRFANELGKQVLFTEYGYKSIEYANSGHWTYKEDTVKTSMDNQLLAYQCLFETIWREEWVAGGFFWKWHMYPDAGGTTNRRYTPQGKPSLEVIKDWYSK